MNPNYDSPIPLPEPITRLFVAADAIFFSERPGDGEYSDFGQSSVAAKGIEQGRAAQALPAAEARKIAQIIEEAVSEGTSRPQYGRGQLDQVWGNVKQDGKVFDPHKGEELFLMRISDHEIFAIIRHDSVRVLKAKLNDVDPAVTAQGGRSMLHMAIAYERTEQAELLIKLGADLDFQDIDGQTPLHYAAIHGQVDTAKLLVANRADQSICDKYGNAPLWYAVFNARGHYELVELYVNAGGAATNRNRSGRSPLDFAKQIQDLKLQEILTGK